MWPSLLKVQGTALGAGTACIDDTTRGHNITSVCTCGFLRKLSLGVGVGVGSLLDGTIFMVGHLVFCKPLHSPILPPLQIRRLYINPTMCPYQAEEGLCEGAVLYHALVSKSAEEAAALASRKEQAEALRAERRRQQVGARVLACVCVCISVRVGVLRGRASRKN